MKNIEKILFKELNSNLDKQEKLRKALSSLKSGNLSMKKRNGKIYFYLEYRDGNKVKTDYLGKEGSDAVKNYLDNKTKIMNLKSKIYDLELQEKQIKKVLNDLGVNNYRTVFSIDEIKRIIKPILKKYNISKAYLFGSYARGEANENSDLDLLISKISMEDTIKFENSVKKAFGKEIDFIYSGYTVQKDFFEKINKEMISIGYK